MQIELIGCTSVGKSTLSRSIIETSRARGIEVSLGDDFLLKQVRLSGLKNYLTRTFIMDLIAMIGCALAWKRNQLLYAFVMRTFWNLPKDVGWVERLNCLRNVLKKLGIHEIVRRRASPDQIILLDEGTLHNAHQLFVHASIPPKATDIHTFVRLVPLPDVAVYLRTDEAVLIERTLRRGHKRIPKGPHDNLTRFIKNAVITFELIRHSRPVADILLIVNDDGEVKVPREGDNPKAIAVAADIVNGAVNKWHKADRVSSS